VPVSDKKQQLTPRTPVMVRPHGLRAWCAFVFCRGSRSRLEGPRFAKWHFWMTNVYEMIDFMPFGRPNMQVSLNECTLPDVSPFSYIAFFMQ